MSARDRVPALDASPKLALALVLFEAGMQCPPAVRLSDFLSCERWLRERDGRPPSLNLLSEARGIAIDMAQREARTARAR